MTSESHWLAVAVATPAHSGIGTPLTYRSAQALAPGTLVRVPLGTREVLGVVWSELPEPEPNLAKSAREIAGTLGDLPPLDEQWRALMSFAARYYQRALGEIALAALPPQLRNLNATQMARRLKRKSASKGHQNPEEAIARKELSNEQANALLQIEEKSGPFLLFGTTGSGKTEVYMRAAERVMTRDAHSQVLVLVPEINLTPQLEARFIERFGADAVVSMHSGLTPAQRLAGWLAAHTGQARIVLGTRMGVLASMPHLALIVVDEEHDPSYKQQEGARYSARDLAIYRGRLLNAKVILGSATPSLESWEGSRPTEEGGPGRYLRLAMPLRIGASGSGSGMPRVRRVDMGRQPRGTLIAPPLLNAIEERVGRGEQALLLLNRRGYAPVLHCADCGWKSECPYCSAYRVFHKIDRTLRCHHCGFTERVPRACPSCGNVDIGTIGRGTEQLEEHLAQLLEPLARPDGTPVRVARIDADSTRGKGSLETQLAQVHAGEVDVLVGTQMIAKGHDFRRVTLVAAINPDAALFSSDFRAPERLFSLLLQAAGRAGRDASVAAASEMWVQTHHPSHPLYEALKAHDYPSFAESQLLERAQAGLPPFAHLALLRADARSQEAAQAFLKEAAQTAQSALAEDGHLSSSLVETTWYPPVPMAVQRVANIERAQMLIESQSRSALQRVLAACQPLLHQLRSAPEHRGIVRWAVDVDPLAV
ncbi:replication restart helicase PriA [Ottowia thiooxydans]|uniref:Replication restart protein PriA n=1 Tax=Ottowia thiooxydans TaxID=219182 RepID=A0ABV2QDA8_9BURK